jgi:hypothetical protein
MGQVKSKHDPLTVPVVVDSVKSRKNFEMTRVTYFSIECEAPATDWPAALTARGVPFVLLGVSGVVHRPSDQDALFDTPERFETLFDTVETDPLLYVDTNHAWLRNSVFEKAPQRGDVFRVPLELFRTAYRYREGHIGDRELEAEARRWGSEVKHSAKETAALRHWNDQQIGEARRRYHAPGYPRLKHAQP